MDPSQSTPAERQWRESLHKELRQRRIPSAWQRRLMEELEDHLADLKEEHMVDTPGAAADLETAVNRLGDPAQIAASAAAEYRKLGLLARWPVLTYFVLPFVGTPLWFVAFYIVTIVAMQWGIDRAKSIEDPATAVFVINTIAAITINLWRFAPFAIAAWCFARLAQRHGRGWRCMLCSCGIVAIYAALFWVSMKAKTVSEPGRLLMGPHIPPPNYFHLFQAAIPLSIAAWFLWRSRPNRNDRPPLVGQDLSLSLPTIPVAVLTKCYLLADG